MHKKILITHEFAPFRGGVATYCAEVFRAAVDRGLPVEVWTTGAAGEERQGSGLIRRLGGRSSLRPGPLHRFAREIFRRRAELRGSRVVLGSVGAQIVFLQLRRLGLLRGIEALPLFHGSEILRYQRSFWLRGPARRWLGSVAEVFATSRHVGDLLARSGWVPPERIAYAPCGLRSDLRAVVDHVEVAPSNGPLRILTLARLHPRKGHRDTIAALALLPGELRRRCVYQIGGAGDPAYLRELEEACRAGGVSCAYLGEIDEERLAETYAQCDLYVMSSRTLPRSVEGFGLGYLEAGAFGKPVAGYRTGGVAEAVIDGVTGLLAEEGDIPALAGALRRLIEDPALRLRLGEAGRAHALGGTWEAAVDAFYLTGSAAN